MQARGLTGMGFGAPVVNRFYFSLTASHAHSPADAHHYRGLFVCSWDGVSTAGVTRTRGGGTRTSGAASESASRGSCARREQLWDVPAAGLEPPGTSEDGRQHLAEPRGLPALLPADVPLQGWAEGGQHPAQVSSVGWYMLGWEAGEHLSTGTVPHPPSGTGAVLRSLSGITAGPSAASLGHLAMPAGCLRLPEEIPRRSSWAGVRCCLLGRVGSCEPLPGPVWCCPEDGVQEQLFPTGKAHVPSTALCWNHLAA